MKAKFLLTLLVIAMNAAVFGQSGDYFSGKRTYCGMPSDAESKKLYELGLKCISLNHRLDAANSFFHDLIQKDSTFCDAYFFAGYTYRLRNMNHEAVVMYYMADSLAQNRSIEFKLNLASACLLIGSTDLSRKKFTEITEFFPKSHEGYYGIALTSTIIGDIDNGLKNINIAEEKYHEDPVDTQFLKGVLLTMKGNYEESLPYFEKVRSKFSLDDSFNGNYSLSLYEVAVLKNDEKMMKKARKHYDKVKDKTIITEYMRSRFEKK